MVRAIFNPTYDSKTVNYNRFGCGRDGMIHAASQISPKGRCMGLGGGLQASTPFDSAPTPPANGKIPGYAGHMPCFDAQVGSRASVSSEKADGDFSNRVAVPKADLRVTNAEELSPGITFNTKRTPNPYEGNIPGYGGHVAKMNEKSTLGKTFGTVSGMPPTAITGSPSLGRSTIHNGDARRDNSTSGLPITEDRPDHKTINALGHRPVSIPLALASEGRLPGYCGHIPRSGDSSDIGVATSFTRASIARFGAK